MFDLPRRLIPFFATVFVAGLIYIYFSYHLLNPADEFNVSMNRPSRKSTLAARLNRINKTLTVSRNANLNNYPLQATTSPLAITPAVRKFSDKRFENSEVEYHGKLQGQPIKSISNQKMIKDRFLTRNQAAHNACGNFSSDYLQRNLQYSDKMTLFAYRRFSWCHIPKVGTTFLSYLNKKVLGKYKNFSDPLRPDQPRDTFFLVREPYSRMVSGYIGKIVTNQPWWDYFGKSIVRMFRANATGKQKQCGNDVSFPEFVKYFIHAQEAGWHKNPHFVPMYERCNPCREHYDYIIHLETLGDDLSYILGTANITANLSFSDEEQTMRGKASSIVSQRKRIVRCESMCSALRKVWWSFHARGLISKDNEFPLREDECDSISADDFVRLSLAAHARSSGRIDKRKQKREAMVGLFLQVPLEDRIKVRDLLALDFQLFGYDPQPDDLFPELARA